MKGIKIQRIRIRTDLRAINFELMLDEIEGHLLVEECF